MYQVCYYPKIFKKHCLLYKRKTYENIAVNIYFISIFSVPTNPI